MIIASNDEHTTVRRAAVSIAVLECIAGAIDARTLPVPEAENTVDFAIRVRFDLLRTQYSRRGQVLIHRR